MITLTLLWLGTVLSMVMAVVMFAIWGDAFTAMLYLFCAMWLGVMGWYGSRRRE